MGWWSSLEKWKTAICFLLWRTKDLYQAYHLEQNSFNININPDGVGGKQVDTEQYKEKWISTNSSISLVDYNSYVESWMENNQRNIPDSWIFIKVTVKLQPNNESDPVYLMKTFKPKFEKIDRIPDSYFGGSGGGSPFWPIFLLR